MVVRITRSEDFWYLAYPSSEHACEGVLVNPTRCWWEGGCRAARSFHISRRLMMFIGRTCLAVTSGWETEFFNLNTLSAC